jgi:hypothetical protein
VHLDEGSIPSSIRGARPRARVGCMVTFFLSLSLTTIWVEVSLLSPLKWLHYNLTRQISSQVNSIECPGSVESGEKEEMMKFERRISWRWPIFALILVILFGGALLSGLWTTGIVGTYPWLGWLLWLAFAASLVLFIGLSLLMFFSRVGTERGVSYPVKPEPIDNRCPNCAEPVQPGWERCPNCGQPLTQEVAQTPPPTSTSVKRETSSG